ncbi:sensor histidine kinase, partial [Selenomonas sp. F0473]
YNEEIAAGALPCRVPKLILQPVVENAIKYGADDKGHIRIHVRAVKEDDLLVITVTDEGNGIAPEKLERLQKMLRSGENTSIHTGVHNVHRRIQLLYGAQYGLRMTCGKDGGTCVEMRCPARVS